MNNLTIQSQHLPDTLADIARFVLIGREKLASVKAEIRAIDKLDLAREVREQKREESQMLAEALLDAEARLGDLLKEIPKGSGGDRRSVKMGSDTIFENHEESIGDSQHDFKKCNTAPFETIYSTIEDQNFNDNVISSFDDPKEAKTKATIISELGFSRDQAKRFETLADNRDLIEHVKQEARENDDLPTRTRVLDLARERERRNESQIDGYAYLDECHKKALNYHKAIAAASVLSNDSDDFKKWAELLDERMRTSELERVEEAITKLSYIRQFLKGARV